MLFVSRLLALAVGLAALVPVQGADPVEPPSRTFVGEVAGGPRSARIALVVQGSAVVAYACSQDKEFNQAHARWYEGDLKDNRLNVTLDGNTLSARVAGDKIEGTVTGPDRKALTFTATHAPSGGLVGLYRGEDRLGDEDFVLGWIVDQRHDVVGACKNKKRGNVIVLRPVKQLPPPPPPQDPPPVEQPDPPPDQTAQQAQDALQAQVDPAAQDVIQPLKVLIPRKLPAGKKVALPRKP
jgi:hypothetical protein